MLAVGLHIAATALLVIPFITNVLPASTEAKNKQVNVTPLDISPYVAKPPSGPDKAGGAGGGKNQTLTPTSNGQLPTFSSPPSTPPYTQTLNLNTHLPL